MSLRKSTCQKYLSYQTSWIEHCAEKNLIYDSPAVERFKNIFTYLFDQGESNSALVFAKRIKYQHNPQHPSVMKYFKGTFNLTLPSPKFCFVWDVQIMFEYFRSLGDNSQISDKQLSQKLLILLLLLGGQLLNSVFRFTFDGMIISSTNITFSSEHI